MKYRNVLAEVVAAIVRARIHPTEDEIRARAASAVEARDLMKFVDLTSREFTRLNDGNITRFRIRRSEYWDWFNAVKTPPVTR
jgi:hypothetical protein